jgi:hypothetical protein
LPGKTAHEISNVLTECQTDIRPDRFPILA